MSYVLCDDNSNNQTINKYWTQQDQERQTEEEEDEQEDVMNISLRDHCNTIANKTITNRSSIMVNNDEDDDYQFTMPVSSILEKYQDDQKETRKRRLFLWILIGLMILSIAILAVCFFTYRRYIIAIVFHHDHPPPMTANFVK